MKRKTKLPIDVATGLEYYNDFLFAVATVLALLYLTMALAQHAVSDPAPLVSESTLHRAAPLLVAFNERH